MEESAAKTVSDMDAKDSNLMLQLPDVCCKSGSQSYLPSTFHVHELSHAAAACLLKMFWG